MGLLFGLGELTGKAPRAPLRSRPGTATNGRSSLSSNYANTSFTKATSCFSTSSGVSWLGSYDPRTPSTRRMGRELVVPTTILSSCRTTAKQIVREAIIGEPPLVGGAGL